MEDILSDALPGRRAADTAVGACEVARSVMNDTKPPTVALGQNDRALG